MSRGWESKDVESQQEEAATRRTAPDRGKELTADEIRLDNDRRVLELSRLRLQRDLEATTFFRRQEQLRGALRHVEERLKELDGGG